MLFRSPLRERKEDIKAIGEYYLAKYAKEFRKTISFAPDTLEILTSFSWPGNVRQLQNTIERGAVLVKNDLFTPDDLPLEISGEFRSKMEVSKAGGISTQLEQIEREAIRQVLEKNNWNQTHSAKELGIGRTALQYKIKKYGIEK